ncbi:hypothetical protein KCP73_14475 [Salmonella enterica subsp. enterica]|nr:hypothetical protein KCP73_14475 [Salmonella enterica subsp. enterica]
MIPLGWPQMRSQQPGLAIISNCRFTQRRMPAPDPAANNRYRVRMLNPTREVAAATDKSLKRRHVTHRACLGQASQSTLRPVPRRTVNETICATPAPPASICDYFSSSCCGRAVIAQQ